MKHQISGLLFIRLDTEYWLRISLMSEIRSVVPAPARRLCSYIRDPRRRSVFFPNEFFQPTYLHREEGESIPGTSSSTSSSRLGKKKTICPWKIRFKKLVSGIYVRLNFFSLRCPSHDILYVEKTSIPAKPNPYANGGPDGLD